MSKLNSNIKCDVVDIDSSEDELRIPRKKVKSQEESVIARRKKRRKTENDKHFIITIEDDEESTQTKKQKHVESNTKLITVEDSPAKQISQNSTKTSIEPDKIPTLEILIDSKSTDSTSNKENSANESTKSSSALKCTDSKNPNALPPSPDQSLKHVDPKVVNHLLPVSTDKTCVQFQSFIDLCLRLENTKDMKNVIRCTVKPTYNLACTSYLQSRKFTKLLNKNMKRMKAETNLVYCFIKNVVDKMQSHRKVLTRLKRIKPTTVIENKNTAEDLTCLVPTVLNIFDSCSESLKKSQEETRFNLEDQNKLNCLNVESNTKKELNDKDLVSNIDEQNQNVMTLDETDTEDVILVEDSCVSKEKCYSPEKLQTTGLKNINSLQGMVKIPSCNKETSNGVIGAEGYQEVQFLEKRIHDLKTQLNFLEKQEVEWDDEADSAYLRSERCKEQILSAHTRLCSLLGVPKRKRGRVDLMVRQGRPEGPTRRLQAWLNREEWQSTPPFPDFYDVLQCVRDANTEDRLGWTEQQILLEARELFTCCGKELQRRRQRREWFAAAARLPGGRHAPDPAEADPALLTRLQLNRKQARSNEDTLIDKYADIEVQARLEAKKLKEDKAETCNSFFESANELNVTSGYQDQFIKAVVNEGIEKALSIEKYCMKPSADKDESNAISSEISDKNPSEKSLIEEHPCSAVNYSAHVDALNLFNEVRSEVHINNVFNLLQCVQIKKENGMDYTTSIQHEDTPIISFIDISSDDSNYSRSTDCSASSVDSC